MRDAFVAVLDGIAFGTSNLGENNLVFFSGTTCEAAVTGNTGALGTFVAAPSMSAVPLPAFAPMFGAALLVFDAVGYGMNHKTAAAA